VVADEDVLQRVVEGVAEVQGSRHVWRRDDDAVGLGLTREDAARVGFESTGLVPAGADRRLVVGGDILGGKLGGIGWSTH